jgi:hypothetical protein
MADTVRRVEYYYVTVADKPGAGTTVMKPLKQHGVNLLAYLGFPVAKGQSQIDLVPERPDALKQAAAKAGLKLSGAKSAFLIQGGDRPGAVAEITGKLADAGINITASAAAAAGGGRFGMIVWVAPADFERAARTLGA